MEDLRTVLTDEEILEIENDCRIVAEDFHADSETEQNEVALEEQSEDDPFLKAELEKENTEVGEIPDAYPYNDLALNISIIQEREQKEWLEDGNEYPSGDLNVEDESQNDDAKRHNPTQKIIQDIGYFKESVLPESSETLISENPELETVLTHGEITRASLDTKIVDKKENAKNIWIRDVTTIPVLGPILMGLGVLILIVIFGGMAVLLAINVTWLFIVIVIVVVLYFWINATAPERAVRKAAREGAERKRAEGLAKAKEERAQLLQQQRDTEYANRRQLRSEIEQMPKYSSWKSAVFEKCGRRCEMCGETNGLEIHHRTSFDSILKAHKINTIAEAFECNALWDINNGSVLCKKCHDKMKSSEYRQQR